MITGKQFGLNGLTQVLRQLFLEKYSGEDQYVAKVYDGTEDAFFQDVNETLKKTLRLPSDGSTYGEDLKRFGTRIKLIDVADDNLNRFRKAQQKPLAKKNRLRTEGYRTSYEEDLNRFGTKPGIIDVANDSNKKKKLWPFPDNAIEQAYAQMMTKWKKQNPLPLSGNPFSEIFREFPKLQITIENTSASEEEVTLWGSNQQAGIGSSTSGGSVSHTLIAEISVSEGIYPQGIIVNPINHYIYVANQLSGTVTVLNESHQVVTIIQLDIILPVFIGPVALAVNTKVTSSTYGYVYVICSISNMVYIIDTTLTVIGGLPTEVRPIAIAFNPVNMLLYITNLASDNMTIIDAELLYEPGFSPLPTGQDPTGVGVNPVNGDIYITGSGANNLVVYNSTNELVTEVPGMGQYPVSVLYNPTNLTMYVVAMNSNTVYQINTTTYNVITTVATGIKPVTIFFHSISQLLYIQNTVSNTFTILKPDNTVISDTTFIDLNIGGTYNHFNNAIYITNTLNNSIYVVRYSLSSLKINDDYLFMRSDFQANPGIVQHTKFVITGPERINSFRHNRFTPTGLVKSKPLSLELFASPQSKLNVLEVTDLAGTIIDGKMNWKFKLPAGHTVTILIWYRQFEVRDLLQQEKQNNKIIKPTAHEKQTQLPGDTLYCHT
jgi:YVTN family beta-propeller protein